MPQIHQEHHTLMLNLQKMFYLLPSLPYTKLALNSSQIHNTQISQIIYSQHNIHNPQITHRYHKIHKLHML